MWCCVGFDGHRQDHETVFGSTWPAVTATAVVAIGPYPTPAGPPQALTPTPPTPQPAGPQSAGAPAAWLTSCCTIDHPSGVDLACDDFSGHAGLCVMDLRCTHLGVYGTVGSPLPGGAYGGYPCARHEGHGGDCQFLPVRVVGANHRKSIRAGAAVARASVAQMLPTRAPTSPTSPVTPQAVSRAVNARTTEMPKPESVAGWYDRHAGHGRRGPYPDARIGEYHRHQCPCGDRFVFSEAERVKDPERFTLPGRLLP